MVLSLATRRRQKITISSFTAGLNTHDEPTVNSRYTLDTAQNVDFDGYRMVRQAGARYYSDQVSAYRSAGIAQWYPQDYSADHKLYVSSADAIYRFTWVGGAVPVVGSSMAFPAGFAWSPTTHFTTFQSFGNYHFAFNGLNTGMQIQPESDTMLPFMIGKPAAPSAAVGDAGNPNGTYWYRYRYVREESAGVREYWGAMSEYAAVSPANQKVNLAYAVPTDSQVNAIYVYRSADGGGPVFYHDRIALADATGTYEDNTADTNTLVYHRDCLDRITNIHWATIFENRLVMVDDRGTISWSETDYPQEVRSDNDVLFQTQMYGGDGDTTGCSVLGSNLYVFKERGIGVFQFDSSANLVQVHTYVGFGNVAPWAIETAPTSIGEIIPFIDGNKHACYMTSQGPKVIAEVSHQTGPFEYAVSDVLDIFENQMAKPVREYKKYISVKVKDDIMHVFYTPSGAKYNTARIRYYIKEKRWCGPDVGLAVGPMTVRMDGKTPASGSGELLGCYDGASCRVVEINSGTTYLGTAMAFSARTKRLATDNDQLKQFNQILVSAKIAKSLRVDVEANNGFFHSYYLLYGGSVVYNGLYKYDAGYRFDDTKVPLFDDGKTFGPTQFSSYDYKWYTINLPPTCRNIWTTLRFYQSVNNPIAIAKVVLTYTERGEL